jgi:hypothetical protein
VQADDSGSSDQFPRLAKGCGGQVGGTDFAPETAVEKKASPKGLARTKPRADKLPRTASERSERATRTDRQLSLASAKTL